MTRDLAFDVLTPLGWHVHCTAAAWAFISTVKHPVMKGRLAEIIRALSEPDEIRVSTKDPKVLLFYRGQRPRWLCAVVKQEAAEGFLITAYPTDAVKIGEVRWTKSV